MKTVRFWPLATIILLPVLVLAGVAAWGLSTQRRAALADAQAQARAAAQRLAAALDSQLENMERTARFTAGIRMPVPPEAPAVEEVKALHAAMDAQDTEALRRLAAGGARGRSEAGLPVFLLAALAGLELNPLAPEFFSSTNMDREPCVLTEKWLLRLEAQVARLAEPPAGVLDKEHPYYHARLNAAHARQYWHHDEWVRRAFWDGAAENWKTRQPGPHVVGGEVFWFCRAQTESKYSTGPVSAESLAVLTEDDLAEILNTLWRYDIPSWMGVSVLLAEKPLHTVAKYPQKGVSLVWQGDGPKRVVEGLWGARTELLESPGRSEVLATAKGIFTVQATLWQPGRLYAATDRMAVWTGWTLACAVLTAGIGLWLVRRTLNKERRLGELKSQFVSSVSHELRAPIGSIRLMAEGLASGRVQGEAAASFHRLMAGEGARLSSLIENVLDFARIEQGRKEYVMAETDLPALLADAVALMQPQAEAKGLRILLECEPLPFVPKVDAAAMQQAVINLLDNAVKFTAGQPHGPHGAGRASCLPDAASCRGQPGEDPLRQDAATGQAGRPPYPDCRSGPAIRVALAPGPSPHQWSLAVTDPGIGIPAAEHARIFERFYRLGNELRRETTGTGIGLAIVKHIVEGHGGTIRVESEPGKGSRFRMEFSVGSVQFSDRAGGSDAACDPVNEGNAGGAGAGTDGAEPLKTEN